MPSLEISINGELFSIPPGSNVTDVLSILKLSPDRVAVELNKTLVRKRDWQTTPIHTGAQLEVVEFVGGG